jgi:hypothetical protein
MELHFRADELRQIGATDGETPPSSDSLLLIHQGISAELISENAQKEMCLPGLPSAVGRDSGLANGTQFSQSPELHRTE